MDSQKEHASITRYLFSFSRTVEGKVVCLSTTSIFDASRRFQRDLARGLPFAKAANTSIYRCLLVNKYSQVNADRIKQYLDKLSESAPERYLSLFCSKMGELPNFSNDQAVCQAIH